ncbi:MAG TPA: LacI family DNA-binding transcriptional regulator [Deinococcales bacterium]|nr:LacI family DNA-binding transcriptional regulator [Deinococcales bacterium]
MARKASIRDVARAAGVGIATVSRSLNGENEVSEPTRLRVAAAAEALGYRASAAARGLVRGRTGNIGVVIAAPHTPVFSNPFYSDVLAGIEEVLEAADLHLLLSSLKRGPELTDLAREGRADGLLSVGCEMHPEELNEAADFLPVVLVDAERPGFPGVSVDNRAGMRAGTGHLLAAGRRRLVFVSDDLNNENFGARYAGFLDACREAGVTPLAAESAPPAEGGAAVVVNRWLDAGLDFDGLVASNDTTALNAWRALRERGVRVPGQVSLIGFDGLRDATGPDWGLASMGVDRLRLGREAARLLLKALQDRPERPERGGAPPEAPPGTGAAPPGTVAVPPARGLAPERVVIQPTWIEGKTL